MKNDPAPQLAPTDAIDWPIAPREPTTRDRHGHRDDDPFAWMRNVEDPRLLAHLEAENTATESATAPLDGLRATLFDEIKGRIRETDLSVPWRKGDWWYQARTFEGRAYPVHVRIPVDPARPDVPPAIESGDTEDLATAEGHAQVVLDENAVAEGHDYSQVGAAAVSPDGRLLAWSVDHTGDETYRVTIRDLDNGTDRDEIIEGASTGLAWSADSRHLLYTTLDATHRPWQVWRHELGTAPGDDHLVFREPDDRFFVGVATNRSDDWIVVSSQSAVTSEHHLLDAHAPTGPLRPIAARRQDVEYHVEAHRDRLFILTNADGAEDFACFVADPADLEAPWTPLIPHERGVRLDDLDAFAGHLVVYLRRDGVTGLRIVDLAAGRTRDVELPEAIGTVSPHANAEFDTSRYRFAYQSLITPPSIFDEDLDSGERTTLKTQEVLGGYDPAELITERIWVRAADGTEVPVSMVRRRSTLLDGRAPCLLYGYGAYEISIDPWFSAARLSLLDRGWVFAIAHVRGGGELGRHWYTDGKFATKPNSFTDFVTVARHLCEHQITAPDRLVARGGSAGGLLVGAALNLAPEQFAAVIAEVPFVDPLNTLLDPSLPLTVIEWEEWGDPLGDPDAFAIIRGYSPTENVQAVPYPAVLATAGLTDPRVSVHEPTKWVQQLRTTTTGDRPILLKVEMGAGHGGPTGRYDAWHDEAFVLAFALASVAAP